MGKRAAPFLEKVKDFERKWDIKTRKESPILEDGFEFATYDSYAGPHPATVPTHLERPPERVLIHCSA